MRCNKVSRPEIPPLQLLAVSHIAVVGSQHSANTNWHRKCHFFIKDRQLASSDSTAKLMKNRTPWQVIILLNLTLIVFFWKPAQEEQKDLGSVNSPALTVSINSNNVDNNLKILIQHFMFSNHLKNIMTFDPYEQPCLVGKTCTIIFLLQMRKLSP